MPLELEGAEQSIVALGLGPTVEERIARLLLERYKGNAVCAAFFTGAITMVVDRELLDLAGGGPAPALYLALVGSTEVMEPSGRALMTTEWQALVVLPSGATFEGFGNLTRLRLVRLLRGLTLGENLGALENEDAPAWPLTVRLAAWDHVDAPELAGDNGYLRTMIGFRFESHIDAITGEV